ncbi:hypothetical protein E2C01_014965 [Portunus trituberculatus]|uniref:Uncharacterized protein n=1 Tax=Portunus trituberculatus TaxID=210409 RepID=A0A5B7DK26_PORTR|nr:hypothetical protein [Portunus trituberculatus]
MQVQVVACPSEPKLPAFVHSHRWVGGAPSKASSAGSRPKFSVRGAVSADPRANGFHFSLPASYSRLLHNQFPQCSDAPNNFVDTVVRPSPKAVEGPWGKVEIKGLVRLARKAAWPWSVRRVRGNGAAAAAASCILTPRLETSHFYFCYSSPKTLQQALFPSKSAIPVLSNFSHPLHHGSGVLQPRVRI